MAQKVLVGVGTLILCIWIWYCQRAISMLASRLATPAADSQAAQINLQTVQLAEANRLKAKSEALAELNAKRAENARFSEAILNVLSQRVAARAKCSHPPKAPDPKQPKTLNPSEYLHALRAIDTAACPKEFRLVWLDYLQAWERSVEYPIIRQVEDVVQSVGAVKDPSGLRDVDERAGKRDTNEAWRQCQRAALQFDVVVPPDPAL